MGTGEYGRLPVMKEVKVEAKRRKVELVIVLTIEAIRLIKKESAANAILHVTCEELMPLRWTTRAFTTCADASCLYPLV
jgi:hypothetical protein